jgi:four helix bundle protein
VGGFRDLLSYQRSSALADELRPNLAEALGRETDADRRRFLIIARGSALELQHWLLRAGARDLALPLEALERAEDVGRLLNGLARGWSRRTND